MKIKFLCIPALLAFSVTAISAADAIDEKQFQQHMKVVGKASRDFKGNFESKNAGAVEKDATAVAGSYKAMASFFKARKTDDAVNWADDSATAANAVAAAAKAGDWDQVKSQWGAVGKNCKSCHDKYREKLDDGSYRIE